MSKATKNIINNKSGILEIHTCTDGVRYIVPDGQKEIYYLRGDIMSMNTCYNTGRYHKNKQNDAIPVIAHSAWDAFNKSPKAPQRWANGIWVPESLVLSYIKARKRSADKCHLSRWSQRAADWIKAEFNIDVPVRTVFKKKKLTKEMYDKKMATLLKTRAAVQADIDALTLQFMQRTEKINKIACAIHNVED